MGHAQRSDYTRPTPSPPPHSFLISYFLYGKNTTLLLNNSPNLFSLPLPLPLPVSLLSLFSAFSLYMDPAPPPPLPPPPPPQPPAASEAHVAHAANPTPSHGPPHNHPPYAEVKKKKEGETSKRENPEYLFDFV